MPDLIFEKRDEIALITLNRPERRNAFSPETIIRLAEAWVDYRDDDDLRVAILTGAGEKAFCAGGDLGSLLPLLTGAIQPSDEWGERLMADVRHYMSTALLRPFELYKPIIAAILPAATLSAPSPGPTVRSSRMLSGAGRAPARSSTAKSFAV